VLSRLHRTLAEVDGLYERYEFGKLAELLYHFAWDEVCDWYVELSKPALAAGGAEAEATRAVLGHVLDRLLRLLHPVTPFVTEALWTALTGEESLVVAAWPTADEERVDEAAEAEIAAVRRVVTEVRRFRADQGVRPGQRVPATLAGLSEARLAGHADRIAAMARLDLAASGVLTPTATVAVAGVTVALDLSQAIDLAAERKRLERDLAAARKEQAQTAGKLANPAFLGKAPEPVVAKIRDRLAAAERDVARLTGALAALPVERPETQPSS
jgi:valyl-tRNA synthetase